MHGVAAAGVGAGDSSDGAALNVYITEDTPAIRNRVLSHIKDPNVRVNFRHIRQRFTAL
jgi:hypothetical protein